MLHNQPAIEVSMVIQGKRYSQEQCHVLYSCEILWSFEKECSSLNSFRTSETVRHKQKCSSNYDVISLTVPYAADETNVPVGPAGQI